MQTLAVFVNLFIVGLGHVFAGRHLAGLLQFIPFAIFVDGMIIGRWVWTGDSSVMLIWFSLLGAVSIWIYSQASLVHILYIFDKDKLRLEMESHYRVGIRALFDARFHDAREEFRACLNLDHSLVNARLLTALSFCEEGNYRRARKLIRECSSLDRDGRWVFEIGQALRATEQHKLDTSMERKSA